MPCASSFFAVSGFCSALLISRIHAGNDFGAAFSPVQAGPPGRCFKLAVADLGECGHVRQFRAALRRGATNAHAAAVDVRLDRIPRPITSGTWPPTASCIIGPPPLVRHVLPVEAILLAEQGHRQMAETAVANGAVALTGLPALSAVATSAKLLYSEVAGVAMVIAAGANQRNGKVLLVSKGRLGISAGLTA